MLKKELLIIFSLALILRLLFLVFPVETSDSKEYRLYALNMFQYHTFSFSQGPGPTLPSTFRTPVYPAFVALVYSLFGINDLPVYIIQCLISAATCIIIYFVSLNLFNRNIAFFSGLACALHPFLYWLVGSLMTEVLFTFLLSATVLYVVLGIKSGRTIFFFFGAIFLGITTLCRPTSQFFLIYTVIILLFLKHKRQILKLILMFILGFLISILPWSVRNYAIFKKIIPISSGAKGVTLYVATLDEEVYDDIKQPELHLTAQRDALYGQYLLSLHDNKKVFEVEQEMWARALSRIKKDPFAYIIRRLRNHPFLWIGSSYLFRISQADVLDRGSYSLAIMKVITICLLHIFPIALYLTAGWLLRREWQKFIFVYLIPIYFAAVYLPIHIEMRYSVPAYPYILIFCTYALYRIFTKLAIKSTARRI